MGCRCNNTKLYKDSGDIGFCKNAGFLEENNPKTRIICRLTLDICPYSRYCVDEGIYMLRPTCSNCKKYQK
jgi:hypothetical protein